jgi:hypothetical protein
MMRLERIYRSEAWMLNLTGFSLLSLLVIFGLWAYAGEPLPRTQGASASEAWELWIEWAVFVAIPIITAGLWLLRLRHSGE